MNPEIQKLLSKVNDNLTHLVHEIADIKTKQLKFEENQIRILKLLVAQNASLAFNREIAESCLGVEKSFLENLPLQTKENWMQFNKKLKAIQYKKEVKKLFRGLKKPKAQKHVVRFLRNIIGDDLKLELNWPEIKDSKMMECLIEFMSEAHPDTSSLVIYDFARNMFQNDVSDIRRKRLQNQDMQKTDGRIPIPSGSNVSTYEEEKCLDIIETFECTVIKQEMNDSSDSYDEQESLKRQAYQSSIINSVTEQNDPLDEASSSSEQMFGSMSRRTKRTRRRDDSSSTSDTCKKKQGIKRKQNYVCAWESYDFCYWDTHDDKVVRCKYCHVDIEFSNGGLTRLRQHATSQRHLSNLTLKK